MSSNGHIEIIRQSDLLEQRLEPFLPAIGRDLQAYCGHIYRVLSYTLHFLQDDSHRPVIETALAYHDLAVWTHGTLAYLQPSSALALSDNEKYGWGYDPQLLHNIIYYHHKVTRFRGPDADIVNAVRKADWIDASKGKILMGMPRHLVDAVNKAIPPANFYRTLERINKEVNGDNRLKRIRSLLGIIKF